MHKTFKQKLPNTSSIELYLHSKMLYAFVTAANVLMVRSLMTDNNFP